jgi:Zn ribbon nucleic-acid-binding protein
MHGTYDRYIAGCDCNACAAAFTTRLSTKRNVSFRGKSIVTSQFRRTPAHRRAARQRQKANA